MGSVNISIREEAYLFLKSLKRGENSFSDVILEFKKNRKYEKGSKEAVLQFAGVLKDKDVDWKAKEKRMREFRESFNKRMKETAKYMERSRK
jgi:predicted CopG family antitoxin